MTVQMIKQGDKAEWAVIPYGVYLRLVEQAKMLQDIQDYDAAKAALARSDEELLPGDVVDALLDGDNPIKVWRTLRDKTRKELAEQVGIRVPYVAQLETNKRSGSLEILANIARALGVTSEDLTVYA